MPKFENWEKNGRDPKKIEDKIHKELTDPVVDDLIAVRKKRDSEFWKRQEEKKKILLEAEQKGILIFSKNE